MAPPSAFVSRGSREELVREEIDRLGRRHSPALTDNGGGDRRACGGSDGARRGSTHRCQWRGRAAWREAGGSPLRNCCRWLRQGGVRRAPETAGRHLRRYWREWTPLRGAVRSRGQGLSFPRFSAPPRGFPPRGPSRDATPRDSLDFACPHSALPLRRMCHHFHAPVPILLLSSLTSSSLLPLDTKAEGGATGAALCHH